jgi:hypothetical protein
MPERDDRHCDRAREPMPAATPVGTRHAIFATANLSFETLSIVWILSRTLNARGIQPP